MAPRSVRGEVAAFLAVGLVIIGILLYSRWKSGTPPPPPPPDSFGMDLAGPSPDLIRRPIVPMDQYVAGVDRAAVRPYNVVFVLLDSFRVDALRATGGPREVMPAVEALAREGSAFPDCTTPATHTNYAMPAAHSSHYPLRDPVYHEYPVVPTYPRVLIYDVLKALGWKTAFFSSAEETWHKMTNYYATGGLDVHFHALAPGNLTEAEANRAASQIGSLDDRITITQAMKWIDGRGNAPFYLSLVLTNCHLPFMIPDGFPRKFGPAKVDFKITNATFPADKKDVAKEIYADSLAYVDSQLARLFDHLKQRGEWDRTIVVVAGDHGEAFYEHGVPAHANSVYEEAARVPLVFRAPGRPAAVDSRPADLIDIPPSLLHLLGLPPHPSFQGLNLFDPKPRPDRIRFVILQLDHMTHIAVYRSHFKLVRDVRSGATALFDLKSDPGEKTDASAANPAVKKQLLQAFSMWAKSQLTYYQTPIWHQAEYPPILREPE